MTYPLPDDLSTLERDKLHEAREEQDAQLTPLFRRWPALSKQEMTELRRLYSERLRVARHLGFLRSRDEPI
jgi:streptomycin 6-kinase